MPDRERQEVMPPVRPPLFGFDKDKDGERPNNRYSIGMQQIPSMSPALQVFLSRPIVTPASRSSTLTMLV
jgi:hypothetical protein